MAMDEKQLKESLILPQTKFPMKANLVQREPDFVKDWDQVNIFEKLREAKREAHLCFHDGPRNANGKFHLGHVINKVLKDLSVKSRSMMGYDCAFIPGWDCHGFRSSCRLRKPPARDEDMERVAIPEECGSMRKKTSTFSAEFQASGCFWRLGASIHDHELFVRGHHREGPSASFRGRACVSRIQAGFTVAGPARPRLRTPKGSIWTTSLSVYVKFPVVEDWSSLDPALAGEKIFVVIWTTTPWTHCGKPGDRVSSDKEYVAYENSERRNVHPWPGKCCLAVTQVVTGLPEGKVLATIPGRAF